MLTRVDQFLPFYLCFFVTVHQACGIVDRLLLVIKFAALSIKPTYASLCVGLDALPTYLSTSPCRLAPHSMPHQLLVFLPCERFLKAFPSHFPFHAFLQDQFQY